MSTGLKEALSALGVWVAISGIIIFLVVTL